MSQPSDQTVPSAEGSDYPQKIISNQRQDETEELDLLVTQLLALEATSTPVQVTDESDSTRVVFTSLPNEIILHIFKETTPPWHEYDPSTIQGAHNPWLEALRTRKALSLVSKSTLGPARIVLYGDIVIRRMGQIPALARTLRVTGDGTFHGDVAHLVRSIRIEQCPVLATYKQTIRECVSVILKRCTQLRSFSYHPHPAFPFIDNVPELDPEVVDGYYYNPMWLVSRDGPLLHPLSSTLKSLVLTIPLSQTTVTAVHHLFHNTYTLSSLVLAATEIERDLNLPELMRFPVIRMHSLCSLEIDAGYPDLLEYVVSRWEIPCLTQLTLLRCTEYPTSFLHTFAAHLTFLHFYVCTRRAIRSFSQDQIENLPRVCPALVHLVIPELQCGPLTLHSSTLQFLDVWAVSVRASTLSSSEHACAVVRARLLNPASHVPYLHCARLLLTVYTSYPRSDLPSLETCFRGPDWPRICHPTLVSTRSHGPLFIRFSGTWVAQFAWGLGSADHPKVRRRKDEEGYTENWPSINPALRMDDWFNRVLRESDRNVGIAHDSDSDSDDSDDEKRGVDAEEALLRSQQYDSHESDSGSDGESASGDDREDPEAILDEFTRSQNTRYHMHSLLDTN
ncbi:uncharacterized protein TRAVEDRAFT_51610 [Trametes versicolor FP-101664 SS1]|uniref:uncharacterized protein n=1 Tax=Trametes versicolor (strain FP-101664) TaxID=717944 RepID=UPI00046231B0|nr:uncharacterized protein TRAVEDRAFT_51610 [Trametes versicolor FP-101664 SS1]EIW53866.1 hypothetical protein TRAVEDRAFT_51610 [Trametes versicolor FP-101664 SS1]